MSRDDGRGRPVRILGIAGSLRSGSYNRALLRAAAEEAPEGVRILRYAGLGDVPPYDADEDVTPAPPAVEDLRASIGRADALLIATPEYNHSVPGVLKNALDWASRPYRESCLVDRPVAVMGASTGRAGARRAQGELRKVLEATGARVVDAGLAVERAAGAFDDDGRLTDDGIRREVARVVSELAATASGDRADPAVPSRG